MDKSHLKILRQGTEAWNKWREDNPTLEPDLSDAFLFGITSKRPGPAKGKRRRPLKKGHRTDLKGIDLSGANLIRSSVDYADMHGANLVGANLSKASFRAVDLSNADLSNAELYETDLYAANLQGATIVNATLTRARLVNVDLRGARLKDCVVFGTAAWSVTKDSATEQCNLRVNDPAATSEVPILVNNIEVAQYMTLFLDPNKVRDVIAATSEKLVLILGRFTSKRKDVLDRVRKELRKYDLVPVIFDFELIEGRSMIETAGLLARMSRFVIADLSDIKLVLKELQEIVPANPSLPVQPIIVSGQEEPAELLEMRMNRANYLPPVAYGSVAELLDRLADGVIKPAENLARQLRQQQPKLFFDQAGTEQDKS